MNNKELEELKKELFREIDLPFSVDKIIEQIKIFEKGISPLELVKPCKIGDGIKVIPLADEDYYIKIFQSALDEGRIIKFVPASGAATRMFKKLLSVNSRFNGIRLSELVELAANGDEDCKSVLEFINNINRFAFYDSLKDLAEKIGKRLSDLINKGDLCELISLAAYPDGLNYSNLPKGCILFHHYNEGARTAFEEHIVEALNYSAGENKVAKIHFTISAEHESEVRNLFKSVLPKYEKDGWKFDIEFSFQSQNTDTISVTLDNKPFRDDDGNILFRPGGHGALLHNLNDLQADIISIKNIDNIVPDHFREETYKYKKVLGGYLISLQNKIFHYMRLLKNPDTKDKVLNEIIHFIKTEFEFDLFDELNSLSLQEKKKHISNFLNRPIRVCGMVKREDHPGGSPFWVLGKDGFLTKQIVETDQVDLTDPNQFRVFNNGTHFNPVDLTCAVKDYEGRHFDLQKFSNPDTGLITNKSKNGRELKALELPGLWNGGMYHWLTIFVEVPKITFNPVKEVNDLLKPEHQPIGK